jgi:hypothetical protein
MANGTTSDAPETGVGVGDGITVGVVGRAVSVAETGVSVGMTTSVGVDVGAGVPLHALVNTAMSNTLIQRRQFVKVFFFISLLPLQHGLGTSISLQYSVWRVLNLPTPPIGPPPAIFDFLICTPSRRIRGCRLLYTTYRQKQENRRYPGGPKAQLRCPQALR